MTLFAMFALAALQAAGATDKAPSVQPEQTGATTKDERKICRRVDATESRLAAKRVCKTAQEWKKQESDFSGR
jgi:hypothetical protein